jgi:hypothetical protein
VWILLASPGPKSSIMATKDSVVKQDTAYMTSFVHLLASTSKHAYPALRDMIEYLDGVRRLPTKIPFETLNSVFKISLNFADSDEDTLSIYTKWIKFLLKFSDNPFDTDVLSFLPDRVRHASQKTEKIIELLNEYWTSDHKAGDKTYNDIVESRESSSKLELLKFLNDDNYSPQLGTKSQDESLRTPDEVTRQLLGMVFDKYFYDDRTEDALGLLNYFPRNWRTFWNAHLCNPRSNEYIDGLIFLLTKEKDVVDDQEVLILQLELKMLVNDVEGYMDEGDLINSDVIREISEEMKSELDDLEGASDAMIDKFTNRLYEKVVFNKARAIYKAIPEELSQEHRTSIYIDIKKVLEFCEDQGIDKVSPMLKEINRVLFEELRDVSSGVNLVCKMLNTTARPKISQYLLKLSYLLEPNSFEMETLYEAFVKHITTQKLSARQVNAYLEIFDKITHPQFVVLKQLLLTFHKDENSVKELAAAILKNEDMYYSHSQSFYVTIDSVFNSRLGVKVTRSFIAQMLGSDMRPDHAKTFVHLLVDYFHEQPYTNMKKDFPKAPVNTKLMETFHKVLDHIVDQSMEDEGTEQEFETKQYAIDECRAFLRSLSSIKPGRSQTVWQ